MKTNVAIRGTKILLKAVITAANHEAQAQGMVSSFSRHGFGYKGLLNSGFSYSPFLKTDDDAEIVGFEELSSEQLSWITDGQDFLPQIVEPCYLAALQLVRAGGYYLAADFKDLPLSENTIEELKDIVVFEPEESTQQTSEEGKNIADVESIPPFIPIGLAQKGIDYTHQVAAIGKDNFLAFVAKIKGAALQKKKFDGWFDAIVKA